MRSVRVFAPATVANVGSAFDVLGFALEAPGDTVTAHEASVPGVRVIDITGDDGRLPRDAAKNTASVSSSALLRYLQTKHPDRYRDIGIDLVVAKGLPIGSGLGSSSASTVAAVVATNVLLGHPLERLELLPFAMEGERIACGSAHADNVAPSLLGGFVLIRSYDPLDIIPLPSPVGAWATVVTPSVELRTEDARKVLKRTVPLAHAVSQWGNVAALVAGIYRNDVALMGRALEDRIVEPERAQLIPGFTEAKQAALDAGAVGCTISGSGPSLFALSASEAQAAHIAHCMVAVFEAITLPAVSHISRINPDGARIINEDSY
jgi:homoserine kinase